jgi:hypothetical protein
MGSAGAEEGSEVVAAAAAVLGLAEAAGWGWAVAGPGSAEMAGWGWAAADWDSAAAVGLGSGEAAGSG